MRSTRKKLGTLSTETATTEAINAGDHREKSCQVIVSGGTWNAGFVTFLASLDGGTTFDPITDPVTTNGFVNLPQIEVGLLKAAATGLPDGCTLDVWFGGLNSRTE